MIASVLLAAMLTQIAGPTAAPPVRLNIDANALIKRCLEHYAAARTYRVDILRYMKFGDQYDMTTLHIEAEGDGKSHVLRRKVEQTVEISTKKLTAKERQSMLDDGTTAHYVYEDHNEYAEAPRKAEEMGGPYVEHLGYFLKIAGALFVTEVNINGRKEYMLTNEGQTASLNIDEETNSIALIHIRMQLGKLDGSYDLVPTNETFDRPIPASDFTWNAPPGLAKGAVREMPGAWPK